MKADPTTIAKNDLFKLHNVTATIVPEHSQEFVRAGEVSLNQATNFCQFWNSKLNVSIKCASSKINYLVQMQIILVNIPSRVYNFKIERILGSLNRGHQTVTKWTIAATVLLASR